MAGFSTALRTSRSEEINSLIGAGGKLLLMNGARPATGGALTTTLATIIMNGTQFGTVTNGVLTADSIADGTGAGDDTTTWARITTSANVFVMDLSIGTSGTEVIISTTTISTGLVIPVTSIVITEANA